MPIEEYGGGPVNPPKTTSPGAAPLAPTGPRPTPKAPPRGSSLGGGGTGTGDKADADKAGKKKQSGGYDATAAERRALAREADANRRAAQRSVKQAETLEAQAKALQLALKSFAKRRNQQLSDIVESAGQQARIIREGYRARVGSLEGAAEENEIAAGAQTGINARNVARERGSAMSEIASLGAGESDALRAQLMSLRNWNANQNEVERGYFDTLRSINSALTDLGVDTKTGLVNNQMQARADKEQVWTDFYNQRSETLTQLGNVRGQQADYYHQAVEYGDAAAEGRADARDARKKSDTEKRNDRIRGGSNDQRRRGRTSSPLSRGAATDARTATSQSEDAFMAAARTAGRSWDNPGVSKRVMNWTGRDEFDARPSPLSRIQNVRTVDLGKKPEGATLRKW